MTNKRLAAAAHELAMLGYRPMRINAKKRPAAATFEAAAASDPQEAIKLFSTTTKAWLGVWLPDGAVVLDFDAHDLPGTDQAKKLETVKKRRELFYGIFGLSIPTDCPSDVSAGGGIRDWFRSPPGLTVRQKVKLVPNVDVKAGGVRDDGDLKKILVAVAPSGPVDGGGCYYWTKPLVRSADLPICPRPVLRLLASSKKAQTSACRYYERLTYWLEQLPKIQEGERRDKWRDAVLELAGFAAPAGLSIDCVRDRLVDAINETGLGSDEIETTYADSARDGAAKPLDALGEKADGTLVHQLIELARLGTTLFPSGDTSYLYDDETHATYELTGCRETENWLGGRWLRAHPDRPVPTNQMSDAIKNLSIEAAQNPQAPVFGRFGAVNGNVYYHSGGEDVAVLSTAGREHRSAAELAKSRIYFRPPQGVTPAADLDFQTAVELMSNLFPNLTHGSICICLAWALSALNPRVRVPLLVLSGAQGSGKSVLAATLKLILDPSGADDIDAQLRTFTDDARTLTNMFGREGVTVFDNVSRIPVEAQDLLCQVITGGEVEARRLYTDGDMRRVKLRSRVIVTSIVQPVSREDLLNRSIALDVATLPGAQQKKESTLETDVKRTAALIRAALLDATPAALRGGVVDVPRVHRLLDWLEYAAAGGAVLGLEPTELFDAVADNKQKIVDEHMSDNPLARALMRINKPWEGTASDLLDLLDPDERRAYKSARGVSAALQRLEPHLKDYDIEVEKIRTKKSRVMLITGITHHENKIDEY
jgi:hypothetical protein